MRFQIIFLFVLISISCHSISNFRVSQGGFNYDKFENTLQELDEEFFANYFRGRNFRGSIEDFDSSGLERFFQNNFDESLQFQREGGERKMSEVNDIISNLSSFIICGYTLIKSIIAIFRKIKQTKN